jgi:carboxymethylenebutenolidase
MKTLSIPTPDGDARAYSFQPEGAGPWPAVIFYMDAPAIRPALFEMAQRLADHGYFVVMPDMFWRVGPYEPMDPKALFADPELRKALFEKFVPSTDAEKSMRDTGAVLDWLTAQPEVAGAEVGATGYCMGGGMALRAAGTYPDRIVAAAGFHPGRLATDAPDSPHLLAPHIKARVYIGGADKDASFSPEEADRLRAALDAAGVDNEVTIYDGALHGYAPPDMPVYNEAAAERHWTALFALLDATLKPA